MVLAGGVNRIELFQGYAPGYKALLSFAGRPAVQYVLEALARVSALGRICLVGPELELRQAIADADRYDFVPAGQTLMASLAGGLEHFRGSAQVLFVTADLPLLSPAAVAAFLAACAAVPGHRGDDLYWAVVPEACFAGPYAGAGKGFNRFRNLAVCHGNLLLTTPGLLENQRALRRIDAVYRARKNSVGAALAIGWKVGLSYLFGVQLLRLLSLEQMARIVSRRFALSLRPVLLAYPEVTMDVDEPEDYRFVKQQLESATFPPHRDSGGESGEVP